MDWKKWIATHVRGTPMSLAWLEQAFPIPVATYGVTLWGPDGTPTRSTKQMTLANLHAHLEDGTITFSWDYGLTVPGPDMPQIVQVDAGRIVLRAADVIALRKLETRIRGPNPRTGEPIDKAIEVHAFYVLEGESLLVIEIMDMKEDFDDASRIAVAKG